MTIWYCPANFKNLKRSILNKDPTTGTNRWGFNARRANSFDKIDTGHICLFRYGRNELLVLQVIDKYEVDKSNDTWEFKPPNGTHWKYVFDLEHLMTMNNCLPKNFKFCVTQTLITNKNVETQVIEIIEKEMSKPILW